MLIGQRTTAQSTIVVSSSPNRVVSVRRIGVAYGDFCLNQRHSTPTSEEGLIQAEGSGCIPYEEQENCQISDPDPAGNFCFFSPFVDFSSA
ncbi:unnamed protein product [Toxocara canis]|uniref:Uncharacterized protein n=1 Tax=Toxocara canis TaxID=6265 RepID=A0A183USV3_TOXCA|nr:unnamed protein product [Toxocara canis]